MTDSPLDVIPPNQGELTEIRQRRQRTRRRELPTVWPYPASNGSAMNLA